MTLAKLLCASCVYVMCRVADYFDDVDYRPVIFVIRTSG